MTSPKLNVEDPDEIGRFAELSRDELAQRWEKELGRAVPIGISRPMLLKCLAWEIQAKAMSGHKPAIRRSLKQALQNSAHSEKATRPKPGARLVREWNGKTHIVDVLEDGFRWEGRTYKSLSPIACDITGTRWSGPRFFGLSGKSS